jgi:hypothetical protein
MDCSDGARMLIERMQTHPEDFAYKGKMYGVYEGTQVSARDKVVITAAYDKYILEPRLMASVLEALLAQPEDEKREVTERAYQAGLGRANRVGMGATDPKMLYGKATLNDPTTDSYILANQARITREMYENHIQTHKELIKAIKQPTPSKLSDIYNKAFGRERVERDN